MHLGIMRVVLFGLGVCLVTAQVLAQGILNSLPSLPSMGPANMIADPAGYFRADNSAAFFKCTLSPGSALCSGVLPVAAQLTIQVSDVPSTATVELLALNAWEQYETSFNFKMLQKSKTVIDQVPVIVQTFSFNELNNVERPVWMQILNAIWGSKQVTVQVQCRSRTCAEYKTGIDQIFNTLRLAPLDKAGMPVQGKLKSPNTAPTLDSVIKELEF